MTAHAYLIQEAIPWSSAYPGPTVVIQESPASGAASSRHNSRRRLPSREMARSRGSITLGVDTRESSSPPLLPAAGATAGRRRRPRLALGDVISRSRGGLMNFGDIGASDLSRSSVDIPLTPAAAGATAGRRRRHALGDVISRSRGGLMNFGDIDATELSRSRES